MDENLEWNQTWDMFSEPEYTSFHGWRRPRTNSEEFDWMAIHKPETLRQIQKDTQALRQCIEPLLESSFNSASFESISHYLNDSDGNGGEDPSPPQEQNSQNPWTKPKSKQIREAEKIASGLFTQELRNTLSEMNMTEMNQLLTKYKQSNKSKKYFLLIIGKFVFNLSLDRMEFQRRFNRRIMNRLEEVKSDRVEEPYYVEEIEREFDFIKEAVSSFVVSQDVQGGFRSAFLKGRGKKVHHLTVKNMKEAIKAFELQYEVQLDVSTILG